MNTENMKFEIAGRRSQTGSVILEALIAILIFSIGILGLIGMQSAAIGNVSDAKFRSEANFLANQIIGQMWASQVVVTNASGVSFNAVDVTYGWPGAGANAYVQSWASAVVASLPNSSAVIAIDPVGQQQVTVTISWKAPKAPAAEPPHVHSVNAYIF